MKPFEPTRFSDWADRFFRRIDRNQPTPVENVFLTIGGLCVQIVCILVAAGLVAVFVKLVLAIMKLL